MATTAKELIAILEKYTKPDELVIWQYYTRHDFALDGPPLTKKQFERVSDRVDRWELWTEAYEGIQQATFEIQGKRADDEV